jgi:sugar-specific transcriptional regulator TrmB
MSFPINQTIVDFLGLSRKEVRLLQFHKTNPHSQIADMAKNSGIPRMTIYSSLNSLKKRGLVHYEVKGKRKLWHIVSQKMLKEILVNLVKNLS